MDIWYYVTSVHKNIILVGNLGDPNIYYILCRMYGVVPPVMHGAHTFSAYGMLYLHTHHGFIRFDVSGARKSKVESFLW